MNKIYAKKRLEQCRKIKVLEEKDKMAAVTLRGINALIGPSAAPFDRTSPSGGSMAYL